MEVGVDVAATVSDGVSVTVNVGVAVYGGVSVGVMVSSGTISSESLYDGMTP